MKYAQLNQAIQNISVVIGQQETKVQKKLFKIFEKLKPYQEQYQTEVEILRLDHAQEDEKGAVILDDKGQYKFTKEGIKKLTSDINALNEQEFTFDKINVVNPEGLSEFFWLKDFLNGVEFVQVEDEEL